MDILRPSIDIQAELIRNLTSQVKFSELLPLIVNRTAQTLKASACNVFIVDPGQNTATQLAGTGGQMYFVGQRQAKIMPPDDVPETPDGVDTLDLVGWILSTGKSLLNTEPSARPELPNNSAATDTVMPPGEMFWLRSFLGVPIRDMRGEVIGVISVERHKDDGATNASFSVDDQLAVETIAGVTSKCKAYLEMAKRGEEQEAITAWARDVIREVAAMEVELDSFLEIVVNMAASVMRSDSCAIFLKDESSNTLTQRAGLGSHELRRVIRAYLLPDRDRILQCEEMSVCSPSDCPKKPDWVDESPRDFSKSVGLTAWIASTGKSFHAANFNELSAHCHHQGGFDKWNFPDASKTVCGAFFGVPLQVGKKIIGVVKVENTSVIGKPDLRDFSKVAQQQFKILAQDIAMAIIRLQTHSADRYRVIRDAQKPILEILRGGLDVPRLAEKVVTETAKLFNARACALFLKEGNRLIQALWAAYGWAQKGPGVREYELVKEEMIKDDPLPEEKVGLTVWIAVKQKKFTAKSNLELTRHPHHKGQFDPYNFEEDEKCESFLGVPLVVDDNLIGVLKVETKKKSVESGEEEFTYFNEQDELVFDLIANSAAIAIQNARLLESRRLADLLLNTPDANSVMCELMDFLEGRIELIDTLDNTAKIMYPINKQKAEIVENFVGLLESDFNPVVLEQLANRMNNHVRDFLRLMTDSIRQNSLENVLNLRSRFAKLAPVLLRPDFFLHDCAQRFLDTLEGMEHRLASYSRTLTQRIILHNTEEHLKIHIDNLTTKNLFYKNVLGQVFNSWLGVLKGELSKHRQITNPYIVGPPIKSTEMFHGREDVFQFIVDNISGATQNNTLVLHGQRRTGKTSILYQIKDGRLGPRYIPVYIDVQHFYVEIRNTGDFLSHIAHGLCIAASEADLTVTEPDKEALEASPVSTFDALLGELEDKLGDKQAIFMFDEFELIEQAINEGRMDKSILGYLRSVIQLHNKLAFIFTGTHKLEELTDDHWNTFFNIAINRRISFLPHEDAERLIREPVADELDIDKEVVDRIIWLTKGHPYIIQMICREMVTRCNNDESNHAFMTQLDAVVQQLLMAGGTAFMYIWTALDRREKLALAALAQTAENNESYITVDEINNTQISGGDKLTRRGVLTSVLTNLEKDELLEVTKDRPLRYRFLLPAFHIWVRTNQSVALLVEKGR